MLSSLGTYDFTDYSNLLTKVEETDARVSELGSNKIEKRTGKNLLDRTTAIYGYFLDWQGNPTSNENYFYTQPIPITGGESYFFNFSETGAYCKILDSSLNKLSVITHGIEDVVMPQNAKYIVISTMVSLINPMMCLSSEVEKNYEQYTDQKDLKVLIESLGVNNKEYTSFFENTFIDTNGAQSTSSGFYATDYINIFGATYIECFGVFGNPYGGGLSFYNSKKDYISSYNTSSTGKEVIEAKKITNENIPTNAHYVRLVTKDTTYTYRSYLKSDAWTGVISQIILQNHELKTELKDKDNGAPPINYFENYETYSEEGGWSNFGDVGTVYKEKKTAKSTTRRYKIRLLGGDTLKYRVYGDAFTAFVVVDKNNVIVEKPSGAWTTVEGVFTSTEEHYVYVTMLTSLMADSNYYLKTEGYGDRYAIYKNSKTIEEILPKLGRLKKTLYINKTDTEIDILNKLINARNEGNLDVFFEKSTYTFSEVYTYMKDTLGWSWTMGLPLGDNCRYYLNGSTIISNPPTEEYTESRNIFDTRASAINFELHDGILINNGGTYCVHDEGYNKTNANGRIRHLYKNLTMKYNQGDTTTYIGKCIGGGTSADGSVEIDSCIFISNNSVYVPNTTNYDTPVNWHGNIENDDALEFELYIHDSYVEGKNGTISFTSVGGDIDISRFICHNNRLMTEPLTDAKEVYVYCNELASK